MPNERLDRDYGPCDSDRRHIFALSATVESPQFSSTAARMLASDWRLSGSFRAASGRTLLLYTGLDRALTGAPNVQRPNQVLDDPYGDKTISNWLNPAAFAQPALGAFGNAGRNAYVGNGYARGRSLAGSRVPHRVLASSRGAPRGIQCVQLVPALSGRVDSGDGRRTRHLR